jgi:hypothetical protein
MVTITFNNQNICIHDTEIVTLNLHHFRYFLLATITDERFELFLYDFSRIDIQRPIRVGGNDGS